MSSAPRKKLTSAEPWPDTKPRTRSAARAAVAPKFRAAPPIAVPADGNDLLWWIVEATSGATGDEFFNALVSRLAKVMKLKYALVTECLEFPTRRVRTLAYWVGGELVPNIEYDLEGTPCKDTIIGQQVCFIPQDVCVQFPPPGTEPVLASLQSRGPLTSLSRHGSTLAVTCAHTHAVTLIAMPER